MTASNHAVTGALLATILPAPIVFPLAFASHFVLDSLPHFGQKGVDDTRNRLFWTMLSIDMAVLIGVYAYLLLTVSSPVVYVVSAFLATSPDLAWGLRLLREYMHLPKKPLRALSRFHSWIQWGERPWGWIIEIGYFCLMSVVLMRAV